ncbi:MAG: SPFH domain-containing protein [Thermodesulfobacteriota bacterium]
MGVDNKVLLENLEWFDESGQEMVKRLPSKGSGEIKFGAQLIVRESQAAILFYKGKACDAFGAGRHTLMTGNIPIVTKLLSAPWGMKSPLRTEVYFANLKTFTNLKWGTRDPVAFKDSDLGLIRIRAHGVFNIRIIQPVLFINTLVGTMGRLTSAEISDYLKRVIISRFNDYLGKKLDTIFNLPGKYEELSEGLQTKLAEDFSHFGLDLSQLYITSITPPPEVQKSIDDQSRISVIKDMDKLVHLKAAAAMEKAAENPSGNAAAGMGMGMGYMMPAMFAGSLTGKGGNGSQPQEEINCPDCHGQIPSSSRFCPLCGHQLLVLRQCAHCSKNLMPTAKFCSRCGHPADEKPKEQVCPTCKNKNLPGALFCNNCGEKL